MCLKCPSKDLQDPHSIEEGRALERGGATTPPSHKIIYNTTSTECKTLKGERRLINGICCFILICGYCATSGVSVSVRTQCEWAWHWLSGHTYIVTNIQAHTGNKNLTTYLI